MNLYGTDYLTCLTDELRCQYHHELDLSLLAVRVPAGAAALAEPVRAQLRVVDHLFAVTDGLLLIVLPLTPAAGAGAVAARLRSRLPAGSELALLAFPPWPDAAPDAEAYREFGAAAWAAGSAAAARDALAGFAAAYRDRELATGPRPALRRETLGEKEFLTFLDYELRRCSRYGRRFTLCVVTAAGGVGLDEALRTVTRELETGDLFGILETGRLFLFGYDLSAGEQDRLLQTVARYVAMDAAPCLLTYPDDATTLNEFTARIFAEPPPMPTDPMR